MLNRSNGRLPLFRKDADYAAFERVIEESYAREPLRKAFPVETDEHLYTVLFRSGEPTKLDLSPFPLRSYARSADPNSWFRLPFRQSPTSLERPASPPVSSAATL